MNPTLPTAKIIVTRPTHQADAMMRKLEHLGLKAYHLPLLKINPLAVKPIWHPIKARLNEYDAIVFVSKNAVDHSIGFLGNSLQNITAGTRIFGMGESTCNHLSSLGLRPQCPPTPETTEGLIALIQQAQMPIKQCLIVKGSGGREDLEKWFEQKSSVCTTLPVYERQPAAYADHELINAFNPAPAAVCITSGESLQRLADLIIPTDIDIFQYPVIVPSQRVSELGQRLGFKTILVSSGAGIEPQTQAVLNLLSNPQAVK